MVTQEQLSTRARQIRQQQQTAEARALELKQSQQRLAEQQAQATSQRSLRSTKNKQQQLERRIKVQGLGSKEAQVNRERIQLKEVSSNLSRDQKQLTAIQFAQKMLSEVSSGTRRSGNAFSNIKAVFLKAGLTERQAKEVFDKGFKRIAGVRDQLRGIQDKKQAVYDKRREEINKITTTSKQNTNGLNIITEQKDFNPIKLSVSSAVKQTYQKLKTGIKERDWRKVKGSLDPIKYVGEKRETKGGTSYVLMKRGTISPTESPYKTINIKSYGEQAKDLDIKYSGLKNYQNIPQEAGYYRLSEDINKQVYNKYQSQVDQGKISVEQANILSATEGKNLYDKKAKELSVYYSDRSVIGNLKERGGAFVPKYVPKIIEVGAYVGSSFTPMGQTIVGAYFVGGFGTKSFSKGILRKDLSTKERAINIASGVGTATIGIAGFGSAYRGVEKSFLRSEIKQLERQPFKFSEIKRVKGKKETSIILGKRELGGLTQEVQFVGEIEKLKKGSWVMPKGVGNVVTKGELSYNYLGGSKGTNIFSTQIFELGGKGTGFQIGSKTNIGLGKGIYTPKVEQGVLYKGGSKPFDTAKRYIKSLKPSEQISSKSYTGGISKNLGKNEYYSEGFSPRQLNIDPSRKTIHLYGDTSQGMTKVIYDKSNKGVKFIGGSGKKSSDQFLKELYKVETSSSVITKGVIQQSAKSPQIIARETGQAIVGTAGLIQVKGSQKIKEITKTKQKEFTQLKSKSEVISKTKTKTATRFDLGFNFASDTKILQQEETKLASVLKSGQQQKQQQKQQQRQQLIQPTQQQRINTPIKPKVIIPIPTLQGSSKPTGKIIPKQDLFEVFGRRFGQDKLLKKTETKKQAEQSLFKFLKGSLGRSGQIKTEGYAIGLEDLKTFRGQEFRKSKVDPKRIVQKRRFSLGTRAETSEIQFFKKKSKKKGKKKSKKKLFFG